MSNYHKYLGRPYVMGKDDCYSLVREFLWEEKGFLLPSIARPTRFWENPDLNLPNVYREYGFQPVLDDTTKPGDLLLIPIRTIHPCHFGVVVEGGMLLHHIIGRLSSLDPLRPKWRNMATITIRNPEVEKLFEPKAEQRQVHEVIDAFILRNPKVQEHIKRASGRGS